LRRPCPTAICKSSCCTSAVQFDSTACPSLQKEISTFPEVNNVAGLTDQTFRQEQLVLLMAIRTRAPPKCLLYQISIAGITKQVSRATKHFDEDLALTFEPYGSILYIYSIVYSGSSRSTKHSCLVISPSIETKSRDDCRRGSRFHSVPLLIRLCSSLTYSAYTKVS
jgi:hypothetical protein